MNDLATQEVTLCNHEPTLIVPHPTGVFYNVQAAGVGCLPMRSEGYLIPLELDNEDRKSPCYSSDVWYRQPHEGYPPNEQDRSRFNYRLDNGFKPEAWGSVAAYWQDDHAYRLVSWWDDVVEQVETSLHRWDAKVCTDVSQYEAWLTLDIMIKDAYEEGQKPERRRVILTWKNCD